LLSLDLALQMKTGLIKEYSKEKKPDDSVINRKIHFEKRRSSLGSFVCPSQHGRDNFDQLHRDHDFRTAFDFLLEILGLESGVGL
jgi:hypothetical protein